MAEFPETVRSISGWIRDAAAVRDWRRVERFANLAAVLNAPGLGEVLQLILDADVRDGLNEEDLVDILGEVRAVAAAGTIFQVVKRSLESDAPAYWLSQKAIGALGDIDTEEARRYLREMTTESWPNPIRWHAAVDLCIEDELGFDEDSMLE
ncbi:hypothetical protein [Micromonospora pallida]|uniref:hypothetical protein n=1 Tax=Micromonospora pallida TaxID=145854 RepID=UPI000B856055|nr:hypothetical protein [Micromonospora pallida]